jgi:hypothetical protein
MYRGTVGVNYTYYEECVRAYIGYFFRCTSYVLNKLWTTCSIHFYAKLIDCISSYIIIELVCHVINGRKRG